MAVDDVVVVIRLYFVVGAMVKVLVWLWYRYFAEFVYLKFLFIRVALLGTMKFMMDNKEVK